MKTEEELVISLTTDTHIINTCALMIAASDPWITLGMNYEQCLVAFDGPCKEIYVAVYKNKIAGFVILVIPSYNISVILLINRQNTGLLSTGEYYNTNPIRQQVFNAVLMYCK